MLAPDRGGVGEALAKRLRKLNVEVLTLDPAADRDGVVASSTAGSSSGAVHGVYWLTALDDEGPVADLDSDGWHDALQVRVKNLAATMKRLYDDATVPRRRHAAGRPARLRARRRALPARRRGHRLHEGLQARAARRAGQGRRLPGKPEVRGARRPPDRGDPDRPGVCRGRRWRAGRGWSIGLAEQPAADGNPSFDMHGGSIYVVTGAAGSIVSAITADLATHGGGGIFHLLDLTPTPDENDADLRAYVADRDGLKAELIARAKAAGEKVTPVVIDKELARIERLSMAQAAIEAVRNAGGQRDLPQRQPHRRGRPSQPSSRRSLQRARPHRRPHPRRRPGDQQAAQGQGAA